MSALDLGGDHPVAQGRFRQLAYDLGTELAGPGRGWKARAAERLGISPSMLSRLLSDKRPIGAETMYRVASELGFDPLYFVEDGGTWRDYATSPHKSASEPSGELDLMRDLSRLTADEWRRVRAWADDYFGEAAK